MYVLQLLVPVRCLNVEKCDLSSLSSAWMRETHEPRWEECFPCGGVKTVAAGLSLDN